MSQEQITRLAIRNTDDSERIALYKRQIAQLAVCIADREGRVERRTKTIERLNHSIQAEFNLRLSRAADDSKLSPVEIGQVYRSGQQRFEVVALKDGVIGIKYADQDRYAVAGKDLEMISKVFFFDHPNAGLVK